MPGERNQVFLLLPHHGAKKRKKEFMSVPFIVLNRALPDEGPSRHGGVTPTCLLLLILYDFDYHWFYKHKSGITKVSER